MKKSLAISFLASVALISWGLSGTAPVRANQAASQLVAVWPEQQPFWEWFKFNPLLAQTWDIKGDPGNRDIVFAKPVRLGLASAQKRILVIYPRPSSAYDITITKMLNVFEDKLLDVDVTVVNFRNEDKRGHEVIALAEREKFDLVLSMGSETTAWLWTNYRNSKIPVVSVCSKDPVVLGQSPGYHLGSGTNFAFTSLNMPIDVQMAYVQELKPKLRNIAVLVDSRNVSAIETQSKPVVDYAKARGIRVLELAVQNPANAKAELEKLVEAATAQMTRNDPDLSNSLFWVTGSTSVFKEIKTINEKASRAAVVSVVPDIVQGGDNSAVLSIGISFESNAHLAAVYVADILRGRATAGALKVGVVSPPDIAISFRKVRDIGLTMPFSFFEAAGTIFDYEGHAVRVDGVNVAKAKN
jgi:putative tryptophan/tyrosine transport system substrate-binding protein